MKYKNFEINLSQCNYSDGVAIIPLNGEIVCLPLEDATTEELQIIQAIRDDVEGRVVEVIEPTIIQEEIDEEKAAMAEAIIDLETRLSELEGRIANA